MAASLRSPLTVLAVLMLVVSACGESTTRVVDTPFEPTPTPVPTATPEPPPGEFATNCFSLADGFEFPEEYLVDERSASNKQCGFATYIEGSQLTSMIAGELFRNSRGQRFDEFVDVVLNGLATGQEPDLLPLRSLNTDRRGVTPLPIAQRIDIDGPNRAVVFRHESDRLGRVREAYSAVVDFDTTGESASGDTSAILIWAVASETNDDFLFDLIDALQMDVGFGD